jgi:hypothetical protein
MGARASGPPTRRHAPEQEQLLRVRRQVPERPRAARRRVRVRDGAVEVEAVRRRQRLGPRQSGRHVQLDLQRGGGGGGGR